jgi:hypothetical protein
MPVRPGGILIIFTDFPLDEDDSVDEWYTREHVRSRVVVDGFLWGKRYEAIAGTPRYVAIYGTESTAVLAGQGYLDVGGNPDENERAMVPKFYNTRRTICGVTASVGEGEGSVIGFVAVRPEDGRADDLRAWIQHLLLPELVHHHGIVAAHLWETDADALAAGSRGFTPTNTGAIAWLVAWEATRVEDLDAARRALVTERDLRNHGAVPELAYGSYRLLYRLSH